ncbi:peptidoglycan-binding domain-containing protein [Nitrobacter sp. NHB1]|uniref:peptidoglycan-binding domain-containing protein n=1 Tax=Nitrobacter sp. NHB1 TaxID=3119830 RepID=UPI002FFE263D
MRPRRRSVATGTSEVDEERGLAMRILLHSPKDLLAGSLAFAAVGAIVANAMFMQAGHHPSPMFGSSVAMPLALRQVNPLPKPRPVEADTAEAKPAELRASETKAAETKPDDTVASVVRPTAPLHAHSPHPPTPIPAPAHSDPVADLINATRRVAAVQRTLTQYGYGQLKPTGTVGTDTQAAIRKFEQTRRMPVTGQMSDRLVRELAAMTGRPID